MASCIHSHFILHLISYNIYIDVEFVQFSIDQPMVATIRLNNIPFCVLKSHSLDNAHLHRYKILLIVLAIVKIAHSHITFHNKCEETKSKTNIILTVVMRKKEINAQRQS